MSTIRQQIIELLEHDPAEAREISGEIGISEKEVYEHLPHIARSLPRQGKKLNTQPARCIVCGYAFKRRQRFTPPGRCPLCKSERIENPRFSVK
ncbi:MAG: transcriptional regulator [Desulfobacterales bacterium]|nr:transcriptional regulator [Desulfobacterales bacterium]